MSSPDSDTDPSTGEIETEFPRWHCWRGISGLLYATRQRTSPPLTVRDENTTELRAQIRAAEEQIISEYTYRHPRLAEPPAGHPPSSPAGS